MIKMNVRLKRSAISVTLICIIYSVCRFLNASLASFQEQKYLDIIINDLKSLNQFAMSNGFFIYILERHFCLECTTKPWNNVIGLESATVLGIDSKYFNSVGFELIEALRNSPDTRSQLFYNKKMEVKVNHNDNVPVALVFRRTSTYILYILYSREDNSWWLGNLANDDLCSLKFNNLLLTTVNCSIFGRHEKIIDKLSLTLVKELNDVTLHLLIPKNGQEFMTEFENSYFMECNKSRSELFKRTFGYNNSTEAQRFRHRAWKLLSKTKTILDLISVPFWISSGTCLGYFRECDIIPYSKDVDIGIMAKDLNANIIIKNMEAHGLRLKHWFGQANDSLEFSFIGKEGIKLDIFFFYEDANFFWNGGTQLTTKNKFKYIFPKFTLCWTLFYGLKLRIPCQIESYIIANYGPDWFTPLTKWDWKLSPNNVIANGIWPASATSSHLL